MEEFPKLREEWMALTRKIMDHPENQGHKNSTGWFMWGFIQGFMDKEN